MMGIIYPRPSKEETLEHIRKKYPLPQNPFKKSLGEVLAGEADEGTSAKTRAWLEKEKREGLKRFWDERQKEKASMKEKLEMLLNPDGKRNFAWLYRHGASEVKALLEAIELAVWRMKNE